MTLYVCAKWLPSCPTLCDPTARILCPWDSPGRNTGVGCHTLLEGIFPTQGSNLRLLCVSCISRQVLYHSCHLGSPWAWFRESSQERHRLLGLAASSGSCHPPRAAGAGQTSCTWRAAWQRSKLFKKETASLVETLSIWDNSSWIPVSWGKSSK